MPQLKYCRSYSRECGKRSAPLGGRGATRGRGQGYRRPAVAPGGGRGRVDIEYDDIPDPTPQRTTATTLLFAPTVRTYDTLALRRVAAGTRKHERAQTHTRNTYARKPLRIHACAHTCARTLSTPAFYTPAFRRPPYITTRRGTCATPEG